MHLEFLSQRGYETSSEGFKVKLEVGSPGEVVEHVIVPTNSDNKQVAWKWFRAFAPQLSF